MLVIRLSRTGKIHDPHYRIVVQEKRSKLNGDAIDQIGHYHPVTSDKKLVIDHEKAKKWMSQGAQPSDTVRNLFVKDGILDKSQKVHNFFTPSKKEVVKKESKVEAPVAEEIVASEAEVAAPTEEIVETPAEAVAEETPVEVALDETIAEEAEANA